MQGYRRGPGLGANCPVCFTWVSVMEVTALLPIFLLEQATLFVWSLVGDCGCNKKLLKHYLAVVWYKGSIHNIHAAVMIIPALELPSLDLAYIT